MWHEYLQWISTSVKLQFIHSQETSYDSISLKPSSWVHCFGYQILKELSSTKRFNLTCRERPEAEARESDNCSEVETGSCWLASSNLSTTKSTMERHRLFPSGFSSIDPKCIIHSEKSREFKIIKIRWFYFERIWCLLPESPFKSLSSVRRFFSQRMDSITRSSS